MRLQLAPFLIGRVAGPLAGFTLAAALIVMDVQIVSRYVFNNTLVWGEEVVRYLIIWSTMFGAAVAYLEGQHTAMATFVDRLAPRSRKGVRALAHGAIAGFCALVAWHGIGLAWRNALRNQLSPALQWPIWYVYAAVPAGFVLIGLAALALAASAPGSGGEQGKKQP